jgi:putative membrane protein
MVKKRAINILVVGLVLLLPGSLALGAGQTKLPAADAKFLKDAAQGNLLEVDLGKLAAEKAASNQVKEFGRRMEQDHSKAFKEIEQLAAGKGVELPKDLDAKHKATVNRLAKLSGEKFDREYMQFMINEHKEDVDKFQREADKAKDPDIKAFAGKELPTLKKHLELARTAGQQIGSARK